MSCLTYGQNHAENNGFIEVKQWWVTSILRWVTT